MISAEDEQNLSAEPQAYRSFAELLHREVEGHDFSRTVIDRASPLVIVALHGGGIEPGTSEIARAIAGDDYSLYSFDSLKQSGNEIMHITSHDFDDPICLDLVSRARVVVSIHGCSGEGKRASIFLGGRHALMKERQMDELEKAGFSVTSGMGSYPGQHCDNICNLGSRGAGIQLEVSLGIRRRMFAGMRRQERRSTLPDFDRFIQAVRAGLQTSLSNNEV